MSSYPVYTREPLLPWLIPWLQQSKRGIVVTFAALFLLSICYLAAKDPKHILGTRDVAYSMVVVFFVGGAAFTVLPYLQYLDANDTGRITSFLLVFLAICCGFLIVLQKASLLNIVAFQYMLWILLGLSVICLVAFTFRTTLRVLIHLPGWLGFTFRFLFFLPCLLVDLVSFVARDLQRSSRYVWLLLFLEVFFLVAYFALSAVAKRNHADDVVFTGPTTLGKKTVVLGPDRAYLYQTDATQIDVSNATIQRNYSISCWVQLNNVQGSLGARRSILFYGDDDVNINKGIPRLSLYVDAKDGDKTKLIYDGNTGKAIDLDSLLTKQVWHHLAVTYDQQQVLVYVDGNLEEVRDLQSVLTYDIQDKIVVGDAAKPALSGAICHVVYHRVALSRDDVVQRYLLFKDRNPPIADTTW